MPLNIGEKKPEWTFEEVSDGRWALKRHGYVVKTAYSIEALQNWAAIVHGKAIGREIGRL